MILVLASLVTSAVYYSVNYGGQQSPDFGVLRQYAQANQYFTKPEGDFVVFIGDSITELWNLPKFFPGKPYVNRGISGQTTPQVLLRYRSDSINLGPSLIVLLAGINDIANITGDYSAEVMFDNLVTMAEIAQSNGIKMIMASVLPIGENEAKKRPLSKVVKLNSLIKEYCQKTGRVYLDYYSAMVDSNGFLKDDLAFDELHPNEAGYKIMTPIAQAAIDQVFGTKKDSQEKKTAQESKIEK